MKCLVMFTKNEILIAGKFEANSAASLANEWRKKNSIHTIAIVAEL